MKNRVLLIIPFVFCVVLLNGGVFAACYTEGTFTPGFIVLAFEGLFGGWAALAWLGSQWGLAHKLDHAAVAAREKSRAQRGDLSGVEP